MVQRRRGSVRFHLRIHRILLSTPDVLERGFLVGATRLTKRVCSSSRHVSCFVIYIVSIGYVAQRFSDPEIINEFKRRGRSRQSVETLRQGLLLNSNPSIWMYFLFTSY